VAEVELAELIREAVPSMEMLRLVSSGTEACMSALRAARGFTGRDAIVKFEGCYHGHADSLLVKAGSGAATFGVPTSAGVPRSMAERTIVLPYNDVEALRATVRRRWREIAAVIVEPVAGNMGVVLPELEWLTEMRALTAKHGIVLIFDEVMTGFRSCFGGVQNGLSIRPDLTCLGKVIGGGMPLAAYGGRREIMSRVAPLGPVYQAGTLSGNPVAVAAGLAQLRFLRAHPETYSHLDELTRRLAIGLAQFGHVNRHGSMLTLFFTDRPVTDWRSASRCDTKAFARFFHGMLDRGFALPPSQFEAWFVSAAHAERDIDATIEAASVAVSGHRSPVTGRGR
jgi:glutamate-1-semialdehyde 2,1-aminomutase